MLKDIYPAGLGAGLPNPNLKPEQSRNWNVGYSHLLDSKTVLQVVLFRSDLRNAIESVFFTDPGGSSAATAYCPTSRIIGFCSEMTNIGKEVHEGVELEVRSTPLPRLTLNASYSYLNRNIAYDFPSLPNASQVHTTISILPTIPKNKAVGTATVRLPYQILGIVTALYEGGLTLQDTTYAATSPSFLPFRKSFATADLGVIIPMKDRLKIQAAVRNIFDRNYYYTAGYPEIGRNWYLILRYRW